MIKRISMTIDEKGLDALNNLAKSMNTSRSEAVKYLIRYYLRIQAILKENTDAFPYYLEDLDNDEMHELQEMLENMKNELKSEDEL